MGNIVLCVLLFGFVLPTLSDKHSLYYIYTALSKPITLPGIYEFTALGLLDDRKLDYFNSQNQTKVPMQDWMREKMQADYWDKGTQSRRSKQQWFKVNVDILTKRMNHSKSDLHVLQWRHGCEIKEDSGRIQFLKGIDEYSYDGQEFLSFDSSNSRWIAPVQAAEPTKRKWDDVSILNQYTKGYLEKECVDWLTKFMDYGKESLRKHTPPAVYAFAKKSVTDSNKLTLTCLATGFYPKDVTMNVRKYRTSLPEDLLTSSGVRPNDDDTYQLRKSVDILESEKADYDCYVRHSSLIDPVITKWDGKCNDCSGEKIQSAIIGGMVGVLLTLAVVGVIICILKCRNKNGSKAPHRYQPPNDGSKGPVLTDSDSGKGSSGSSPSGSAGGSPSGSAGGSPSGSAGGSPSGSAGGSPSGSAEIITSNSFCT